MSSVYNLRVWCSFCAIPWETSLTNTREKKFPFGPTLLYAVFSPSSWACSRAARALGNPPARPEMKWWKLPQFKLIHTSHLWHDWFSFRVLKYGIVFLLFSLWKRLMYTAVACQRGGRGWHIEEQLKWIRMKFESAIFHLSITFQRDPWTTNRETRGGGIPICGSPRHGALGLINQDISCWPKFGPGTRCRRTLLRARSVTLLSVLLIIYTLN